MKYIRTKNDEILEVEKLNLTKIVGNIQYDILDNSLIKRMYGSETHMYKYKILAQADTIEELCDGFYLDLGEEFDDTYLRRKDRFEFLKELALEYMRRDMKVTLYGVIKTSKGLIYVAKLNNEGKLVLI